MPMKKDVANKLTHGVQSTVFARIMLATAMVFIIAAILVTAVEFCAKDSAWVRREYEKLDISEYSGMSIDDMCRAFSVMVDFMTGRSESMHVKVNYFGEDVEMYNSREIGHMHDVRNLYSGVMLARIILLALAAIGIIIFAFVEKRNKIYRVSKYFLISLAAIAGIFVLLGIWAIIDFDSFWIFFHFIFLDVAGSTFDPAFSRMIRICPAELFSDMVFRIFMIGFGACALLALIAAGYLIIRRERNRKRTV